MQNLQNELLYQMQNFFPLEEKPFQRLAQMLGSTEEEIMAATKKMKDEKIIRQTSAIFDTKRLGYKSSLVAFKIAEERVQKAVEIINAHPGVSHNYLRNHEYNIWFTLATAPNSKLGLEKTIEILKDKAEADDILILPTLKMFKISVKMDTTGSREKKEKIHQISHHKMDLTPLHTNVIRELQKDIEITYEPFKKIIEKLDLTYEEFFHIANELQNNGVMRRFATILNHRKAGFGANAMSVWSVPAEKSEQVGETLSGYSAVSHCYLRPSFPNWSYNIFAMVHAKTQEECDQLIDEMAEETGIHEYKKLYSTEEFKKQRIIYFDETFEKWEKDYVA